MIQKSLQVGSSVFPTMVPKHNRCLIGMFMPGWFYRWQKITEMPCCGNAKT